MFPANSRQLLAETQEAHCVNPTSSKQRFDPADSSSKPLFFRSEVWRSHRTQLEVAVT